MGDERGAGGFCSGSDVNALPEPAAGSSVVARGSGRRPRPAPVEEIDSSHKSVRGHARSGTLKRLKINGIQVLARPLPLFRIGRPSRPTAQSTQDPAYQKQEGFSMGACPQSSGAPLSRRQLLPRASRFPARTGPARKATAGCHRTERCVPKAPRGPYSACRPGSGPASERASAREGRVRAERGDA